MIVTQRGFQANTRIVSVVDELLADVVNMKR
jgi:flagellar hook protein FlgE